MRRGIKVVNASGQTVGVHTTKPAAREHARTLTEQTGRRYSTRRAR